MAADGRLHGRGRTGKGNVDQIELVGQAKQLAAELRRTRMLAGVSGVADPVVRPIPRQPTVDIRVKLAAAQQYLSMRDYVERILLATVPPLPANERLQQRSPMSPDVIALLRETRHAVSEGRTLPDSTDLIHRMREERSEHLAKL